MQKNEVRTLHHALCKKINSKLTKDLNVRVKAITFLEENISANLYDLATGNGFLTMKHKKQNEGHLNIIKLKNFVLQKTPCRK